MYIDALHDRKKDIIRVVERQNGKRVFNEYPAEFSFYFPDKSGPFTGIDGKKLSKYQTQSNVSFRKELKKHDNYKLYEGDIKPVFKILEQHYLDTGIPDIHTAPIDIEVDFCKERGFAPPEDPHQPITAVTIGFDWLDKLVTLVLAPKTLSDSEAQKICEKFDDTLLCESEEQLLHTFYELIEDVDILYTWNGEGFDIPYIVNRTKLILGRDYTRKLCLWDELPQERKFQRFGKEQQTYDICGRIHLDYLNLYKKYTYHEMHSYRLDAIGEYEIGETKIAYEGTLDQLYNQDFEKFIAYNRQDTALLSKLDKKLKFINLTNVLAHDNCVLFQTTMGAVALTDQAIVLEAHKRGVKVHNRRHGKNEGFGIAGAYVADPATGLSEWIGSIDINSLYPSAIRCLNMSPETLVAQIKPTLTDAYIQSRLKSGMSFADAWSGRFSCLEYEEVMNKSDVELVLQIEDTKQEEKMTAAELYDWVFNNDNLCISANGTIFRIDEEGVIPGLLTKWYAGRKEMQKTAKEFLRKYEDESDPALRKEYKAKYEYWDTLQLVTKIKLNSLYGAVSNVASRFADQRIGQSTTLTGRSITKHMNSKANEILTGEYDYKGSCIIYADTDSAYFTVAPVKEEFAKQGFELSKESFIELSESIANAVNESFPEFVQTAFNTDNERASFILCGREICGIRGMFVKKKRYAILIYDKEGSRKDIDGKPGSLKIMGMDTQRSDTPKSIQIFLKDILMKVLEGNSEDSVIDFIREKRSEFKDLPAWEKGMPKSVNNLTTYRQRIKSGKKGMVPGHVMASLNWNKLKEMNSDNYAMGIIDGQKVVVCKLKENPLKMKSIAYPADELNLPKWFKELPFDDKEMEEKLIDQKLSNIIGSLNWDLDRSKMSSKLSNLFQLED